MLKEKGEKKSLNQAIGENILNQFITKENILEVKLNFSNPV